MHKPRIQSHTVQQPQQTQPAAPRPRLSIAASLLAPQRVPAPRPHLQIDVPYVREWVAANMPLGCWTNLSSRYAMGFTLDANCESVLLLQDVGLTTRQFVTPFDDSQTSSWYPRAALPYTGPAIDAMWSALLAR